MEAYDTDEDDPNYWDALHLLQEAERLAESSSYDDVAYAATLADTVTYVFDNLGSHIDLSVHRRRLNRVDKKIREVFEE